MGRGLAAIIEAVADPGAPSATTWLDFERPAAEVQALFFDVDLAVRDKIHRGVRLQWLPRAPDGERRLRRHLRILDKMQVEEIVVERAKDGAWVQRFVEGPNVGTRFVATFEATEPSLTRVRMEAFVGPKGFAQGLGKLSPLGLEKAMKRTLGEYKRALQGYQAGRAHGAVLAALAGAAKWSAAMRGLDDARRRSVVSTLLETAWSIACVDGGPDDAERDAMRAVVAALWNTTIDPAAEERMVRVAIEAVAKQGAETRFGALGTKLRTLGFGELGVQVGVLVAEVSHGLDPSELDALRTLAHAAGVPDETLHDLVRRTEETLAGGDPLARMSTFV
jgi:tellurite resistance protein